MKNNRRSVNAPADIHARHAIASVLVTLAAALLPGCAEDADQSTATEEQGTTTAAATHLLGLGGVYGLDGDDDLVLRDKFVDELGETHVRFQQMHRKVKVWQGEAIVHLTGSDVRTVTQTLRGGIDVSTQPSLSDAAVKAIAHRDLKPRGGYVASPEVELVIYPETVRRVRQEKLRGPMGELNAEDLEERIVGYSLAYHVHAELENGAEETSHTDYIIDAHGGAILKKWSTLHTATATGTGNSAYSGTVSLSTNSVSGGFELRDVSRSMNFATYNLNHASPTGSSTGTIFTDADNTWGDGANYTSGGSTTSANGQTAGVDAHYGTALTFDYYFNVHRRNGIDGAGRATFNRVHYGTDYDNAFWSDRCFCMTYGDGRYLKVLTSLDVAGHEMSHGVTSRTANLTYSGESGGLNEAFSDIHGTMVEFYARGGSGSTIGNTGGNWTIGEQLNSTPLRYMYKPSLDGSSPDAWSSSLAGLDVHYSSGPMNRAFYFLSQGASSDSSSTTYSSYLPGGMTGIGNEAAARIAYRALTVYMTSSTNYERARTAFISAATDLFGASSAEVAAVQNAFAAINVGSSAGGGGTGGGGTGGGGTGGGGTTAEVEPNGGRSSSQAISTSGTTVSGTMSSRTDTDYYRVSLGAGRALTATLAPNASSDYDLTIYNSSGRVLTSSSNDVGVVDTASWTNSRSTAATVYVRVIYYSGPTGSSGTYSLNLTF